MLETTDIQILEKPENLTIPKSQIARVGTAVFGNC